MEESATGGKVWSPEEEERQRQEYLDIINSVAHTLGADDLPAVSARTKVTLKVVTYIFLGALGGMLVWSFSFLF